MADLLQGVHKQKHVWKVLDLMREVTSRIHEIDLDECIEAALRCDQIAQDIHQSIEKMSIDREAFAATDVNSSIELLKSCRAKLLQLREPKG
jgi:hypothetical protein